MAITSSWLNNYWNCVRDIDSPPVFSPDTAIDDVLNRWSKVMTNDSNICYATSHMGDDDDFFSWDDGWDDIPETSVESQETNQIISQLSKLCDKRLTDRNQIKKQMWAIEAYLRKLSEDEMREFRNNDGAYDQIYSVLSTAPLQTSSMLLDLMWSFSLLNTTLRNFLQTYMAVMWVISQAKWDGSYQAIIQNVEQIFTSLKDEKEVIDSDTLTFLFHRDFINWKNRIPYYVPLFRTYGFEERLNLVKSFCDFSLNDKTATSTMINSLPKLENTIAWDPAVFASYSKYIQSSFSQSIPTEFKSALDIQLDKIEFLHGENMKKRFEEFYENPDSKEFEHFVYTLLVSISSELWAIKDNYSEEDWYYLLRFPEEISQTLENSFWHITEQFSQPGTKREFKIEFDKIFHSTMYALGQLSVNTCERIVFRRSFEKKFNEIIDELKKYLVLLKKKNSEWWAEIKWNMQNLLEIIINKYFEMMFGVSIEKFQKLIKTLLDHFKKNKLTWEAQSKILYSIIMRLFWVGGLKKEGKSDDKTVWAETLITWIVKSGSDYLKRMANDSIEGQFSPFFLNKTRSDFVDHLSKQANSKQSLKSLTQKNKSWKWKEDNPLRTTYNNALFITPTEPILTEQDNPTFISWLQDLIWEKVWDLETDFRSAFWEVFDLVSKWAVNDSHEKTTKRIQHIIEQYNYPKEISEQTVIFIFEELLNYNFKSLIQVLEIIGLKKSSRRE